MDLLEDAGFGEGEISVLMRDDVVRGQLGDDQTKAVAETAGAGAIGGTAVGGLIGLLAGASALMLPGVGGVLAAGTLAAVFGTTAAGLGIGAAYGGFLGALIGLGISDEEAHRYVQSVRQGGILVTTETDQQRSLEALKAMREANALVVDAHPGKLRVEHEPDDGPPDNQISTETVDPNTITVLNNLVRASRDTESDFGIAAQNVKDHELRRLLEEYAQKHEQFGQALQDQAQRLDSEARPGGGVTEGVKRGWFNIRAAMTIEEEKTDFVVLGATATSEAETLKLYREALDEGLPAELSSLVETQFAEIEEMYDHLSTIHTRMRDTD